MINSIFTFFFKIDCCLYVYYFQYIPAIVSYTVSPIIATGADYGFALAGDAVTNNDKNFLDKLNKYNLQGSGSNVIRPEIMNTISSDCCY